MITLMCVAKNSDKLTVTIINNTTGTTTNNNLYFLYTYTYILNIAGVV